MGHAVLHMHRMFRRDLFFQNRFVTIIFDGFRELSLVDLRFIVLNRSALGGEIHVGG